MDDNPCYLDIHPEHDVTGSTVVLMLAESGCNILQSFLYCEGNLVDQRHCQGKRRHSCSCIKPVCRP